MPQIDPDAIRQGDRLNLSRALTAVENGTPEGQKLESALFPYSGHAHLIGMTGAPGTGKSTLVNQLVKLLRQTNDENPAPKIAIIAVDPTSPFTGGALLGDRIRMQALAGDKGVFIRSMASRGTLGGIAQNTAAFATILDSAGFDIILVETIGAGQAEVEISRLAHTVVVVDAPGLGDGIQAIKAGILEIADILVVNKADRPGADNTANTLQAMLEMGQNSQGKLFTLGKHLRDDLPGEAFYVPIEQPGWKTPILKTIASEGKGVEGLINAIQCHRSFLVTSCLWEQKETQRLRYALEALIKDKLVHRWQQNLDEDKFESVIADLIQRKISPIDAASELM